MIAHLRGIGVDLKRRPPKSLPTTSLGELLLHERAVRKDSAVHVSLSSYSLVKQPGTWRSQLSGLPESGRNSEPPTTIGSLVTAISEELRRRAIAPSSGRHARGCYIGPTGPYCQQFAIHETARI